MGTMNDGVSKMTNNITKALGGGSEGNGTRQQGDGPRTGLCPDCKEIVSKLAKTCPHCGRPLESEDILVNPADKPWYNRTAEDQRIIAKTSGRNTQKSGGAGVIGIVFAIIIAVIALIILLPKLTSPEVQGILKEVTK